MHADTLHRDENSTGEQQRNERRQEWARLISAEWQNGEDRRILLIESRIKTGALLLKAKDDLRHGEFGKMFSNAEVPFGQDKAGRLMAIARHHAIGDSAHARNLPPSEYTLYLLTRLPTELLNQMLADGRLHPDLERRDVEQIIRNLRSPGGELRRLIAKLQMVEPALSKFPTIPLLTHFWFTGKQLMAFNAGIALAVPMLTDFRGAVPGKLLKLLQTAGFDDDIELASRTDHLIISNRHSSRVRIKLTMLPPNFLFQMPKRKPAPANLHDIAQFIDAIQHCLLAVSTDTAAAEFPEFLGVTLVPNHNRLDLCGMKKNMICRAQIDAAAALNIRQRAILPRAFCEQMVRLYADLSELEKGRTGFAIYGRHALFGAGDALLYGRLLETRSPLDFISVLDRIVTSDVEASLVDIPKDFCEAAGLASLICDEERLPAKLTVQSGQLSVSAQSDSVSSDYVLPIADAHQNISVAVEPALLRRAKEFSKMRISNSAIVFTDGTRQRLCALSLTF
jgi:DNA polymerase III sliding clamp (beta) subunit (PCNA family)